MDKFSLIIALVIGVLIFRQFLPKEINRFDIIGLPILALYKTYSSLPNTLNTSLLIQLIMLIILGALVGRYQAQKTKVIYNDNKISTVGGISYVLGLLFLIIGRVIILVIFNFTTINTAFKNGSFKYELTQFLSGTGDWILWSTIAASSVLYSLTLHKKHPEIRKFIKEQLKR